MKLLMMVVLCAAVGLACVSEHGYVVRRLGRSSAAFQPVDGEACAKITAELGADSSLPPLSDDVAVTVVGTVSSESGEPLSSVEILFVRSRGVLKSGKRVFDDVPWGTSARVNAAGYFEAEGRTRAEAYLLEVTKQGYWPVEIEVPPGRSCFRVVLAKM